MLPADAQFCSRCGLRVSRPAQPASLALTQDEVGGLVVGSIPEAEGIEPFDFQSLVSRGEAFDATESGTTFLASGNVFTEAEPAFLAQAPKPLPAMQTTALPQYDTDETSEEDATPLLSPSPPSQYVPAEIPQAAQTSPAATASPTSFTGPLNAAGAVASQGTLALLPQEEVVQQFGALYLTNKRVILLDASVIRSAFVRDIDAVGTMTMRAPIWQAVLGGGLLALGAVAIYAQTARDSLEPNIGWAYIINPLLTALLFVVLGVFLLARYFLWTKRSLFVSVKGRPLITVSLAYWASKKLAGMDSFVNSFFQVKDFMSGDLAGRQVE